MAAIGAGTMGGFHSPNPSAIFHRQKIRLPTNYKSDGFSKQRFKVVFRTMAFKQGLEEKHLNERQYFNARVRVEGRRKLREAADPCKRKANQIYPLAILTTVVGLLVSCCGFLAGWAQTFPLGDISPHTPLLKVLGSLMLAVGTVLIVICHLLYYKNDTKKITHVATKKKGESKREVSRTRRLSDRIFCTAILLLPLFMLSLFVGYFNDWSTQAPITQVTSGGRRMAAVIGIVGTVSCVVVMWVADMVYVWATRCPDLKHLAPKIVIVPPTDIMTAQEMSRDEQPCLNRGTSDDSWHAISSNAFELREDLAKVQDQQLDSENTE